MASDQVSAGSNLESGDRVSEVQEEKPSFLNKVKASAKKLKSKIKHHGTAQEAPRSGDPHVPASAPGPTDMDVDESDTSESDDEGKNYDIPYTPLSNAALPHPTRPPGATVLKSEGSPIGAVTSGPIGYGTDAIKAEDKSFPEDPSLLKSEGPAGTEQAVPTNYSYFNADPEKAYRPSDSDASQRKQEVSSSLGGESAGLTPAVEKISVGTENSSATRIDSLSKSGDRDAELPLSSVSSEHTEQVNNAGLVEPSEPSEESLLSQPIEQDQGLKARGPSLRELASHSLTPRNSLQGEESAFPGLASDEGFGFDGTSAKWSPDLDTVGGANNGNASSEDHHQGPDGVAAVGVAGARGDQFESSNDEALVNDDGDKSLKLATRDSEDSGFQPAEDIYETGSETLPTSDFGTDGFNKDGSFLSTHGQDLGEDNSGRTVEEEQPKPISSEDLELPSNDGEQKTLAKQATESATGLKNTVASKLGYGDEATSDSTPVSQKATDSAAEGKEYAANTLSSADQGLSSDEKPVSEKVSEAASQAKDAAAQKTNTDQQGKTFAGSITDSISGLPSMFTSKLGIGGGSPTSSPTSVPKDESAVPTSTTPTSDSSQDSSKRKDTPYPEHPSTAAPGLFDRVSGIASSLFGGGAKQPASEGEKPTVEN